MKRILVAGIGNIFFGDDAFGCEVAEELANDLCPKALASGILAYAAIDLAYAMMEDYDAVILVDALSRGEAPGTLYLIEPEINKNKLDEAEGEVVNAHSMNPVRVLQMVRYTRRATKETLRLRMRTGRLESEDGRMGLSERVAAAVEPAVNMIQKLVGDLTGRPNLKLGRGQKSKTRSRYEIETIIGGSMDDTNIALLAWEILGAIVVLVIIIFVIMMIPEMRRYLRLKNM